ncbi:MAG: glutamate racemase, partial [Phycisphaerae bacterium]|nr:glutamate racemase [Phycisphaerae bacterium]
LGPLKAARVACLVLGCTHYPLLKGAIAEIMGTDVTLIDSSEAMAEVVRETLRRNGLLAEGACEGQTDFWVSDNPERFARLGERFLEEPIERIRAVSADEFFAGGSEKDSTLRVGSEG